ncbi:MAG: (Dimethylallyl)adenosine tRNA methylthiotransferase MiaB [candidate division CPR2 bacterium GW2011_GWC1_41_48]|uniref:tRNA-2-methylthio-N(6)-dimethylallyladenosine synthase n=1 Tax=candidate division CPR2 bacterium GW2011_GWC1_41_48 TaxID=1618344 RepID=A0A0G0W8B6_UNCC2|nr:MAG: (Dimethylallyl)adenosine tRNA methylthiotransferase MiaB [candidate division CPR2 bacterium GW2011_GWC2_39_35]KKR29047.1 MAG: (Dimethylallyl)adenosine tRNA methylthiotransferase MiaB [candidate division CPR2 bacterium GW2011_GWD1_39_7]KKS09229.1 MAG: (Dimethylallyl)adenosine tRNA methylthiotransferase MiaB [candidate division CPR2 bacterium GW2011_GWC1_41_48]
MNMSDAERIATTLESINYTPASTEKEADLIVVVSCSVRQSAIDRIHGKIRNWNLRKTKEPLVTVLTGCVLDEDRLAFKKVFDLVFDIENLAQLPAMLADKTAEAEKEIENYFKIIPRYTSAFQAFVPIMTGCNNFCSYCAVPYVRGREYSRPHTEIIAEVRTLLKNGYKEITLLGQNVNSYGNDNPKEITFPELVQLVNDESDDFWLRYITSHPKDMSDELIKKFIQASKLTDYLHLPLQSGSNEILKKMNRHYIYEHYKKLIEKVRAEKPDIAISTDIIVGFPGETNEQFMHTVRAFEEIKYDMAYISQYSPRSGTAAAKLEDDVPKPEKKHREKVLTDILAKTALKHNKKYLDKEVTILADRYQKGVLFGRSGSFKLVAVKTEPRDLIGKFVKVKITDANAWALTGEMA